MNVIEKAKELKNCPFCGGDAELHKYEYGTDVIVNCKGCDIQQGIYWHKDDAIKAWNTRTPIVEAQEWNPNMDDMAFIKRWVQRVHDKETTLEEFYGVLRYYEPLKPITEEANDK